MALTQQEIDIVAPNLGDDMMLYLLRPTPGMTNPPLCTLHELRTIYTLDDLANMHELIDLQDAQAAKAASIRKKEIDASRRKTR